ncbi:MULTISPECIES: hypothetical protein [Aestuariibaculum]|uniref:Uncharacterized protein n=1 Tax=Aestuariibaculum lutulentum TaxID=2920935 RepID=A0ABS9RKQ9_9FLAO|nr:MULTISPECIES: hypothetical protein [Aestuariibaculum]MCH4553492.1 hypothetical protein [Aestuariibaculum lutulentum]MCR8667935.1 hypothetical protein [Aestuariibaculum sp. M13]
MEYTKLKDQLPEDEGKYNVNIKSGKGFRESIAIWTPHVGFVLIDDSLVNDEYIEGWHI